MAKQVILFNKEKADSNSKTVSVKPAAPDMCDTFPMTMMDMSAFAAASSIGNNPKHDIENDAMQAQFAATQALYASMGYPSTAARAAASTYVSVSASEVKESTKTTTPPFSASASTELQNNPFANFLGMPSFESAMKSIRASSPDFTRTSCMDMDRIEELNQFAMQQAAAANVAAAAATAAIKAAEYHRQMKGSASKATPMPMPMFFPFPQFHGFQAP